MNVRTSRLLSTAGAAVMMALCAQTPSALAQESTSRTAAPPSGTTVKGTVDPLALEALKSMGNYLNTLQNFELHATASAQTGLGDMDLQVHIGYESTYRVQRPNKFYVELKSDRTIRQYFYDGKTFTVNVPRQNYHSTVAAPSTIAQMIRVADVDYGISLPLIDLFTWAEDPGLDGIETAIRVGFAKINGRETDHFAYRGPDLDWQLWIARGEVPVPLKIVITDRTDTLRPSYQAELTWNTSPQLTARDFAFTPDAQSTPIKIAKNTEEK